MSYIYMFEKMMIQKNNHTREEKIEYAVQMRDALVEKDFKNSYVVEVLQRIIDRKDNTILDISIYSSYINDLLKGEFEEEYKVLKEKFPYGRG